MSPLYRTVSYSVSARRCLSSAAVSSMLRRAAKSVVHDDRRHVPSGRECGRAAACGSVKGIQVHQVGVPVGHIDPEFRHAGR